MRKIALVLLLLVIGVVPVAAIVTVNSGFNSENYWIGDTIQISGTNTDSNMTYLCLYGGPATQAIKLSNSQIAVVNNNSATFDAVSVNSDHTWEYSWNTQGLTLNPGTYGLSASSTPTIYDQCSFNLKKYVSASLSPTAIYPGAPMTISIQYPLSSQFQKWILGDNYFDVAPLSISQEYSSTNSIPSTVIYPNLTPGQYYMIIQSPIQNGQYTIEYNPSTGEIINLNSPASNQNVFSISGANAIQGSSAASALVQAIRSPNVGDSYVELTFTVLPATTSSALTPTQTGTTAISTTSVTEQTTLPAVTMAQTVTATPSGFYYTPKPTVTTTQKVFTPIPTVTPTQKSPLGIEFSILAICIGILIIQRRS